MQSLELTTIVRLRHENNIFRPQPTRILFTTEVTDKRNKWEDELRYQALQHANKIIRDIKHKLGK